MIYFAYYEQFSEVKSDADLMAVKYGVVSHTNPSTAEFNGLVIHFKYSKNLRGITHKGKT